MASRRLKETLTGYFLNFVVASPKLMERYNQSLVLPTPDFSLHYDPDTYWIGGMSGHFQIRATLVMGPLLLSDSLDS